MRHRAYFPRDRSTEPLGDTYWRGVDMRREAHQLEPGLASEAINMRFNRGVPESRLGMMFLPWLNKLTTGTIVISSITRSGSTATATTATAHSFATGSIATISGATQAEYNGSFIVTVLSNVQFTYTVTGSPATPATGSPVLNTYAISPWGTVYGVGVFNDPRTFQDYLIIAADGNVYFSQVNNAAQQMTLPSGIEIESDVTFTQAFDTFIMFRGHDLDEIQLTGVNQAWTNIVQTDTGDGTQPIPRAVRAEFLANRIFIPTRADELIVSDFGDHTRYLPAISELKVNQGSSDKIVNIAKFNDTTLVVLKNRSIYALSNIYGELSEAQLDTITDQFGLLAAESLKHCGSDLLFLSEHGVMSIRQTEQNKLQSVTLPLSEPIQPLIERINWNYAGNSVAAYWNNRYYLAVPLDDAEELGPELVPQGKLYTVNPIVNLVVGQMYRFVIGANDTSMTHDGTTYTRSIDFTATATTATLIGSNAITASIREITKGVNNAVLVYDFLNQAWAGYDQAGGLTVKKFFVLPYYGRSRLFLTTHAGWVALYEEDWEDQIAVPYVDVRATSVPANGGIIWVNGGTGISSDTGSGSNTSTTWGTNTLANAQANLWSDFLFNHGYNPAATTTVWTAPNTLPVPISDGVRFYSTNGVLPTVTTIDMGSTLTVTYHNTQQIETTLVTRGYQASEGDLSDFRWLSLDVQTWNPDYSVSVLTDGVEEETVVDSAITKDRTLWYKPFDKAAFGVNNTSGDFMDPWRYDYSVEFGNDATQDCTALRVDTTTDGIAIGRVQEARESRRINPTGRSCRVKVECAQGRIRITGCKLETQKDYTKAGTEA